MGTTARLDRFLLSLLGLLLTAGGVLSLLVGFGVFGDRLRHEHVFGNTLSRFIGRNGQWLWPVIALVGLLLGYLALRWLVAQLQPTGVRALQLEPRCTRVHTDLVGAAVTDTVSDEISRYRGVAGVNARLVGDELDPELRLRVRLDARADVATLRHRIETDAIRHQAGTGQPAVSCPARLGRHLEAGRPGRLSRASRHLGRRAKPASAQGGRTHQLGQGEDR